MSGLLGQVAKVGIMFLALFIALNSVGINMSAFAVLGGAIGVGRVLDVYIFGFEFAGLVEGFRIPYPGFCGFIICNYTESDHCGGIGIAERASLNELLARFIVG